MPGMSSLRHWTPVARSIAWQESSVPSFSFQVTIRTMIRNEVASCGEMISTPEPPRLRDRPSRNIPAREARRKPKIVLDARALGRLSSRRFTLHHDRFQSLRSPVDRRGKSRRAAADDR